MNAPIVRTRYGALKGTVVQNVEGGQYFAFNGIPFAEPPVGQLRFKEPQPPKAWSGIRDSQNVGSPATQLNPLISEETTGSEDCLYLNVCSNSLSGKRAVMVWIHGGAFIIGTGDSSTFRPDYFLKKDIVFVSMNYRLTIFGFLNVDDVEAAGNQGLKDQVAALKWVQENIEAFGGDPQNVTIFGDSAGSVSVHYLTLSPLAKGLFHKAIGQSGSALNNWTYNRNNKASALRLAGVLGLETTDGKEAAQFLRTVDAKTLTEAVVKLSGANPKAIDLYSPFGPTTDDKSEKPFLPLPLFEMAKKGIEVPSIFGHNSHEGILSLAGSTDETYSQIDNNFDAFLDKLLINQGVTKTDDAVKAIRKYYFGDEPITPAQRDNYVQLLGDLNFVYGVRRLIEIQSHKKAPVYFYIFSAIVENPFVRTALKIDVEGTCHGDQLTSIFYPCELSSKLEPDSKDRVTMERFTKMWTNFAKTGNPTPKLDSVITKKWLPVTSQEFNYFEISEELIPGVNNDQEKWEFWKSISDSA